jgi:hypothetical protein
MIRMRPTAALCSAALALGLLACADAPVLAAPAAKLGGVEVRQASGDGSPEPLIATFKTATCRRIAGGFFVLARTGRAFRLTVDIDVWRGFGHAYPLLRAGATTSGTVVFVHAPGGHVYDSSIAVPGSPGGGAVAFARGGKAISIGGVFFEDGDMSRGVVVTGAMPCTKPKKKKNVATAATKAKKNIKVKRGARGPRGARGRQGAQGPQGPQGPRGAIGPSNAFEAHNDAGTSGAADVDKTIATLANLPAGAYAISAKVTVTRGAPAGAHVAACTLTAGADTDGSSALAPDSTGIGTTVTTQLTHTFATTGAATVTCTMLGAAWTATKAKIIAIKVGSESKTAVTG